MNFKYWLLSEEEKIAKAKPLTDVNSIRYIKNAQKLIALGNHFKDPKNNGKEPYRSSPLGKFLNDKRRAFQDSEKIKIDPNHKKTALRKWYKTDKQLGIDAGLPKDWHLFTGNYTPERHDFKILKQKNDQNLNNLGIHFKKFGEPNGYNNSSSRLGTFLSNFLREKRRAFQDFENKEKPNYIKTTSYKWYDTDPQVAKDAGLPKNWHLFPDKYTPPERPKSETYIQKNDRKLIALGNHFKDPKNNGKEPHWESELGNFLREKRRAFQDFQNKEKPNYIKNTNSKWYDTDLKVAEDAGLPNDWHLFTGKYTPERKIIESEFYRKKNDQNLKNLGIYFQKFGEPNHASPLGDFLYSKRKAFQDFENNTTNTKYKWYDTDLKVAEDAGLPKGWNLPNDKESISQGEKLVGKTLNKLKLNSINQYQDKECNIITGQCLRFDYSFIYKDQEYFVEYHGEQHYCPVSFGSTEGMTKKEISEQALDAFEIQKKNDL